MHLKQSSQGRQQVVISYLRKAPDGRRLICVVRTCCGQRMVTRSARSGWSAVINFYRSNSISPVMWLDLLSAYHTRQWRVTWRHAVRCARTNLTYVTGQRTGLRYRTTRQFNEHSKMTSRKSRNMTKFSAWMFFICCRAFDLNCHGPTVSHKVAATMLQAFHNFVNPSVLTHITGKLKLRRQERQQHHFRVYNMAHKNIYKSHNAHNNL